MAFELHISIPDNSPESHVVESVVKRDHVSPEEAVRTILRSVAQKGNPAQRMIGLFSSEEDSAIMDDVMELVAESRRTQTTRDIGL